MHRDARALYNAEVSLQVTPARVAVSFRVVRGAVEEDAGASIVFHQVVENKRPKKEQAEEGGGDHHLFPVLLNVVMPSRIPKPDHLPADDVLTPLMTLKLHHLAANVALQQSKQGAQTKNLRRENGPALAFQVIARRK